MMMILGLIFLIPVVFLIDFWSILIMFFFMSFIMAIKLSFNFGILSLSYFMGLDLLSYTLILLSFWVCSLMILASENLFKENYYWKLFLCMIIFLMLSLYLTFSSLNLFVFYLFFEMSLIPTLFLIIGWGNQPERISAGVYLLFYTLLVSLPMMGALAWLYKNSFSMDFYFFNTSNSLFLYLCMNMVFFVKIPMYFIHLWLPKAHVEAPISDCWHFQG